MTSTDRPTGPDGKPSMRIQLAVKLLRSGTDSAEAAHRCAVPLALLEFITDHVTGSPGENSPQPR